ncbi:hypothetical protein CHU98_g3561 [Xylaria longipes]|nr:hypothetical protein CHU98_g3561 [Xylaria longipes]
MSANNMPTHNMSAGNMSAHNRLFQNMGPNRGCRVNMYIQPNDRGDLDYHGLPTLISTRDESLAIIASLPPGAEVHYMVMLPRNPQHSRYANPRVREDVNRRQIKTAKESIAEFKETLEILDKAAKEDPSKTQFRDRFYARHCGRIETLNYMIHVGENIIFAPQNQEILRELATRRFYDPPPPYTP